VAQSADGRQIVTVGMMGTFLWDTQTGRLIRQLEKKQDIEQDQYDQSAFRDAKTLVVVLGKTASKPGSGGRPRRNQSSDFLRRACV